MISLLSAAQEAVVQLESVNHALSGVFGSISLTAWICLLVSRPSFCTGMIG